MGPTVASVDLATEGNTVASSCQHSEAVQLWREIAEKSGLQDKALADAAGMKPPHYSKVSAGSQGDLLGMVIAIGKTYPGLRRAFIVGLAELEGADPLVHAAEQLIKAASRFLKLQSEVIPMRMARAGMDERKRGVA